MRQENNITINNMENKKEYFDCLCLSREDFNSVGFNADNVSDGQMQRIADKIGEICMDYFWESLRYWGEELNLPKCQTDE